MADSHIMPLFAWSSNDVFATMREPPIATFIVGLVVVGTTRPCMVLGVLCCDAPMKLPVDANLLLCVVFAVTRDPNKIEKHRNRSTKIEILRGCIAHLYDVILLYYKKSERLFYDDFSYIT
jgi:hypothetical protein